MIFGGYNVEAMNEMAWQKKNGGLLNKDQEGKQKVLKRKRK